MSCGGRGGKGGGLVYGGLGWWCGIVPGLLDYVVCDGVV